MNRIILKNIYQVQRNDNLFDKLKGAKVFSKINLRSPNHNKRVRENDIHKTTFRSWYSQNELFVMPLGLSNTSVVFYRDNEP